MIRQRTATSLNNFDGTLSVGIPTVVKREKTIKTQISFVVRYAIDSLPIYCNSLTTNLIGDRFVVAIILDAFAQHSGAAKQFSQ